MAPLRRVLPPCGVAMTVLTAAAAERAPPSRLWNRDFFLLWQGQLVSQLGSQAAFVAMMLWTLEATGSPGTMALLMITSSLPGVLLGPIAGVLVDRHGRKALLVGGDVARGLVALGVGAVLVRAPSDASLVLPALFLSAVVSGVAGAVFGPAVRSALPDLVPPHRLAAGNSLTTMGGQVSSLLGLAAGGAAYAAVGPAVLFIADGISYLLSALTEAFIRLPRGSHRTRDGRLRSALARYAAEAAEGLRYCLADPGRRGFIGIAGGLNFLFMPIFVLLPVYVGSVLGAGLAWYGFLLSGLSAGSLLGLLCAGSIGDRERVRGRALSIALVATGAGMALLGLAADPWQALALLRLIGALTGMVNVLVITLMQVRTPPELRGRAMAVLISVTGAATPLGLALGGGLGELAGGQVRSIFVLAGAAAVALSAGVLARPPVRAFLG
ncbi:MAG TPA: MFS transporter, partial [Longimicrobiales bacterium]|nr:MFS transporter [Longimicrobiales bacterium]